MTDDGELARAKLNLCLHVTGQRADGYHLLDSLVVFPSVGDVVYADPSRVTSLTLTGPFGLDLSAGRDNLVLQAAALMPKVSASLLLHKVLPLASGLGGGSADAAATLRLLAQMGGTMPEARTLLALGADVPVCVASEPARMRGIGENLTPLPPLPVTWCVLANPRVACPTPQVFAALATKDNAAVPDLPESFPTHEALFAYLEGTRNDLEPAALSVAPVIGAVLDRLRRTDGCALARMSGSGATAFGLYAGMEAALEAADRLRGEEPGWWVAAASF